MSKEAVKMNVPGTSMVALSKNCKLAPGPSESLIKYLKAAHMDLEKTNVVLESQLLQRRGRKLSVVDRRVGGPEEEDVQEKKRNAHVASVAPSFSISSSHLCFFFPSPSLFLFFPNGLSILLLTSELII